MTFTDIAIDAAVIVPVGPDRAGKAAYDSTDSGAFERIDATDDSADSGTASSAQASTCGRAAKGGRAGARIRIVASRNPFIVLAFADIAVGVAVIVAVRPDRAADAAYSRADGGTRNWAEAADNRTDPGARGGTDGSARAGTGESVVHARIIAGASAK